jgi:ribosomal protein S17
VVKNGMLPICIHMVGLDCCSTGDGVSISHSRRASSLMKFRIVGILECISLPD